MKNQVSVGVELADTFSKLDVHTDCNANSLHLIQMVTQLICVRLVKKLLQLMPPEIFLAMKEKFPLYYVTSYLQHQFHFNLQELVKDRLNKRYHYNFNIQNDHYSLQLIIIIVVKIPQNYKTRRCVSVVLHHFYLKTCLMSILPSILTKVAEKN